MGTRKRNPRAETAAGFSENLRRRRAQLGLTLNETARRSGVSAAMLSEIENSAKTPTISVACQIAQALEANLSEMLGVGSKSAAEVVRRTERPVMVDPAGVRREVLSPSSVQRDLEIVSYVIPRNKATGVFPPHRPGSFEHVTVLEGRVRVRTGTMETELAEGDSISFAGDVEHQFTNRGTRACRLMMVIDLRSR